ncbi:MAG TPA: hypothetical protein VGW39_14345 [Chthoniobacterales bacterium]|nr:hypothetical protein [Chthoniobacterales bacterium]
MTLFIGVLLFVFGSKLAVINRYGSDLPFQDQWGKEAAWVLAPLLEGDPAWLNRALAPHNEHRIYFTLGMDVALTLLSGQWDELQECVAGALLHAVIAASLAVFAWRRVPGAWRVIAAGVIVLLTSTPLVWDNVLWGFQSQFYFLIGFSLLGIDGLLRERFSPRWFLGLLAMLCALVSMGSGFLCAVVVLPLLLRQTLAGERAWRAVWVSLIAAAGIVALGWWFHFEPPWHAGLRAESAADFFTYAVHCLAWPMTTHVAVGALFYSPLLVLGVRWLRHGAPPGAEGHAMKFTLAAGGWVLLQIAALAYARGKGGGFPANRYGDVLAVGLMANAFALGLLASPKSKRHWIWAAAWLAALLLGAGLQLEKIYREDLPQHRREARAFEATVRSYLIDGDADALRTRPIPFPDYDWFLRLLDRPSIRAILPPSVSPPHRGSTLSEVARRLSKLGWAFVALGAAGVLLVVSGRERRPANP